MLFITVSIILLLMVIVSTISDYLDRKAEVSSFDTIDILLKDFDPKPKSEPKLEPKAVKKERNRDAEKLNTNVKNAEIFSFKTKRDKMAVKNKGIKIIYFPRREREFKKRKRTIIKDYA